MSTAPPAASTADPVAVARRIRELAHELGFQHFGISGVDLGQDEEHLRDWLQRGLYGTMQWMAAHGDKRSRPQELIPGTLRVGWPTKCDPALQSVSSSSRGKNPRSASTV